MIRSVVGYALNEREPFVYSAHHHHLLRWAFPAEFSKKGVRVIPYSQYPCILYLFDIIKAILFVHKKQYYVTLFTQNVEI
ncbi:hypothetical protein CTN02_17100 [Lysinibacillus sphaericus]|nr:hypothetical protein CTN02_17100 [Lysinibacillus sphaericus]